MPPPPLPSLPPSQPFPLTATQADKVLPLRAPARPPLQLSGTQAAGVPALPAPSDNAQHEQETPGTPSSDTNQSEDIQPLQQNGQLYYYYYYFAQALSPAPVSVSSSTPEPEVPPTSPPRSPARSTRSTPSDDMFLEANDERQGSRHGMGDGDGRDIDGLVGGVEEGDRVTGGMEGGAVQQCVPDYEGDDDDRNEGEVLDAGRDDDGGDGGDRHNNYDGEEGYGGEAHYYEEEGDERRDEDYGHDEGYDHGDEDYDDDENYDGEDYGEVDLAGDGGDEVYDDGGDMADNGRDGNQGNNIDVHDDSRARPVITGASGDMVENETMAPDDDGSRAAVADPGAEDSNVNEGDMFKDHDRLIEDVMLDSGGDEVEELLRNVAKAPSQSGGSSVVGVMPHVGGVQTVKSEIHASLVARAFDGESDGDVSDIEDYIRQEFPLLSEAPQVSAVTQTLPANDDTRRLMTGSFPFASATFPSTSMGAAPIAAVKASLPNASTSHAPIRTADFFTSLTNRDRSPSVLSDDFEDLLQSVQPRSAAARMSLKPVHEPPPPMSEAIHRHQSDIGRGRVVSRKRELDTRHEEAGRFRKARVVDEQVQHAKAIESLFKTSGRTAWPVPRTPKKGTSFARKDSDEDREDDNYRDDDHWDDEDEDDDEDDVSDHVDTNFTDTHETRELPNEQPRTGGTRTNAFSFKTSGITGTIKMSEASTSRTPPLQSLKSLKSLSGAFRPYPSARPGSRILSSLKPGLAEPLEPHRTKNNIFRWR
ncbi:hypothetical protein HDU96_010365 [Phlyctochytrium bullatum]|nr:hypothetical protein HDU96_010365 [Phlyctochytrium bullatum]